MSSLSQAYEANPEAFRNEIMKFYRRLLSIFDFNMNNMLEEDGHIRFFKVMGHMNYAKDMASFKVAFNHTGSVPLDFAIDDWIQFRLGTATTSQNDTIDRAIRTALHPGRDTSTIYEVIHEALIPFMCHCLLLNL